MLKESEFEKVEKEAYDSFKALMPRAVSDAVEKAVQNPGQVVDWLQAVESVPTVRHYDGRLLEIAQLRMLRRH